MSIWIRFEKCILLRYTYFYAFLGGNTENMQLIWYFFIATKKGFIHHFYLCIVKTKEAWVSGLNQHTANVPNRMVPKVRILLLPQIGSLAQLD